jgi:phosphonoacetaldehyde hydrolase
MARIQLVVLDWAGTAIDFGCFAPVSAFVDAFARHGVAVSARVARGPMGLHKKDHIRELLRVPDIAGRWRERHGRDWTEADVESVFQAFVPLQLEVLDWHCDLIPELLPCVAELRRRGVRIGTTTGYFRDAARRVFAAARRQGYHPDTDRCPEDVPAGRPAPWMIFSIMQELGVYPPSAVVKVGDTAADMAEGRNSGAWAVGVLHSSSEVGCTADELAALPAAERQARLDAARRVLTGAGAHAVVETLAQLPALLVTLEGRSTVP